MTSRGVTLSEDDVVITRGAQHAISIAAELLLDPGDEVLVEEWTYPGALDVFHRLGAEPSVIVHGEARCAYVMPGVSNPLGRGMPAGERRRLLDLGIPIIADEALAELRFDGRLERPLFADASDRVFHVGTFSKTLSPGLRTGYLVAPAGYRARARQASRRSASSSGELAHRVVGAFVEGDHFDARLGRARRFYEMRAEKLVRSLQRRFPSFRVHEPEGGYSLLVETDRQGDELSLLQAAAEHGVAFETGSTFRTDGAISPIALRLTYSQISPIWIDEAVARLERAWNDFHHGRLQHVPRRSDIRELAVPAFDSLGARARSDAAE